DPRPPPSVGDVAGVTAHVRQRGHEGPSLAWPVDGPTGRDPAQGPDLVLLGRDRPDDRVGRADAGLILIQVLLADIEGEKRVLPEQSQIDGTMIRAAAR